MMDFIHFLLVIAFNRAGELLSFRSEKRKKKRAWKG